jgi:hypothetical protein
MDLSEFLGLPSGRESKDRQKAENYEVNTQQVPFVLSVVCED